MRIRWIRGFFRVWLLASVAWVIGAFFWFLWDGMQTQCMFGDPPGAAEGATWAKINMRYNWMLFPIGPVILLILLGFILLAIHLARWVSHGFRDPAK